MARRDDQAHALEARDERAMSGEHPAVVVKATLQGRRAILALRPGLQVIDIVSTWRAERQDVAATARYFRISGSDVRAVLRYYADNKEKVDQDFKAHLEAQQNRS